MRDWIVDIAGLVAVGLISAGVWMIYMPAALIVAGSILLTLVVLIVRRREWGSSAQRSDQSHR